MRPGASGIGFLGSWAVGSAFPGAQVFPNEPEQRGAGEGVPVAAAPLLGAGTAELHEHTGRLQPP